MAHKNAKIPNHIIITLYLPATVRGTSSRMKLNLKSVAILAQANFSSTFVIRYITSPSLQQVWPLGTIVVRYISKPQPPASLASGHFCNKVHQQTPASSKSGLWAIL